MMPTDQAAPVRPGEQLDIPRLEAYLAGRVPGAHGPLCVEQFPHGHSNLTYLLRLGGQELVLRRPPVGNTVKSAHDMGREFRVLSGLCTIYEPAPRPLLYCEDESVLGAPFYIMERRHGVILRQSPKHGTGIDPHMLERACEALVENLARLHALDYQAAGLAELARPGSYVERQVTGWADRYRKAQTAVVPAMDELAAWLHGHRPADTGQALIHNDYKFDNLVLDPADLARVVAVLDWEMATIGDPLMDLGTTLGYWVEADDADLLQHLITGPTNRPGALTRQQVAELYLKRAGRKAADMLFYYVFGLFKIAVIVQQIYARYVRGHTGDERFAHMDRVVAALSQAATEAIKRGSL